MVIVGAPVVGLSCFIFKNGTFMVISCIIFTIGLALLLYRKEVTEINESRIIQATK